MDALGQRITPGDIVVTTEQRTSGFYVEVVGKVKPTTVQLITSYSSRKQKENVIVITEEQLINYCRKEYNSKQDANGMVRMWRSKIREYEDITLEQAIHESVKYYLQISRSIKNLPLEQYEPINNEEREELNKILNR